MFATNFPPSHNFVVSTHYFEGAALSPVPVAPVRPLVLGAAVRHPEAPGAPLEGDAAAAASSAAVGALLGVVILAA